MSDEKDIYDSAIIGDDPVGLFAAFHAGIHKAKTRIVDSLLQLGGQLTILYPEEYVYDIPEFPTIKAGKLIASLEKQTQPLQHDVYLEEEITHLVQGADGLLRLDTTKDTYYSKTVIFAIGSGAFQPRRLTIKNTEAFEGEPIHYYVTGMKKFADGRVAVAGGGDSATDRTLMLENVAGEASIIHRRPRFCGHEHSVEQLERSSVSIRIPYIISNILKENETFTGIQLAETRDDQTLDLPLNGLVINYGFTSSLTHLKEWGLDVSRNTINVHSDMSINIPGVYTIGDICSYEGKMKLIATGFGETSTTISNALHYLRPDARCQPVHSTSLFENGVPK